MFSGSDFPYASKDGKESGSQDPACPPSSLVATGKVLRKVLVDLSHGLSTNMPLCSSLDYTFKTALFCLYYAHCFLNPGIMINNNFKYLECFDDCMYLCNIT